MNASISTSTFVVLFGGLMQGSFTLPQKYMRGWSWESAWTVYSFVGLLFAPWAVAAATVPGLVGVYRSVGLEDMLATLLFGFGWGIANVCFGIAVQLIGMAISFAIVVGLSAALGSLIPFLFISQHPDGSAVIPLLIGIALTLVGLFCSGAAGQRRESLARFGEGMKTRGGSIVLEGTLGKGNQNRGAMVKGIVLCLVGGVLAPMLNFSFAFGSSIMQVAVSRGADASNAPNAVWAIALSGGFLSNAGYSMTKLIRNRNWSELWDLEKRGHFFLAALMGILWTGGLFFYGRGATGLGRLGSVVGWPVFQASIILISSLWGAVHGEWRNADGKTLRLNYCGLASLVAAIAVLSIGNRA
jgi:L-rhamnose-H+ transport protein